MSHTEYQIHKLHDRSLSAPNAYGNIVLCVGTLCILM